MNASLKSGGTSPSLWPGITRLKEQDPAFGYAKELRDRMSGWIMRTVRGSAVVVKDDIGRMERSMRVCAAKELGSRRGGSGGSGWIG